MVSATHLVSIFYTVSVKKRVLYQLSGLLCWSIHYIHMQYKRLCSPSHDFPVLLFPCGLHLRWLHALSSHKSDVLFWVSGGAKTTGPPASTWSVWTFCSHFIPAKPTQVGFFHYEEWSSLLKHWLFWAPVASWLSKFHHSKQPCIFKTFCSLNNLCSKSNIVRISIINVHLIPIHLFLFTLMIAKQQIYYYWLKRESSNYVTCKQ